MNEKNTQALQQTYPEIFPEKFSFYCGDGWFELIHDLCSELTAFGDGAVQAVQVKEKFGRLRFYVEVDEDKLVESWASRASVREIIAEYSQESLLVCETCGDPGELRTPGMSWLRTLCLTHYAEALVKRISDYTGLANRLSEENRVLKDELRELKEATALNLRPRALHHG